jgi:methyl-accepting chemotaxis protein
MLDKWAISWRINSGFLLLTILLVGFALFAHRSVGNLGNGYTEYRAIAKQTISIAAYAEDLFEARVAAYNYRLDARPEPAA